MKFHVVMTTINVPNVLATYMSLEGAEDVIFHIVMDWKTPHEEVRWFVRNLPKPAAIALYSPAEIKKSVEFDAFGGLLGFNHDGLRVAAFIEAYRQGADVVITVDDDNEPEADFFTVYKKLFASPEIVGVGASAGDWVRSLPAPLWPRGYPYQKRATLMRIPQDTAGRIVFHQGLTHGDPDVDALTRANGLAKLNRGDLAFRAPLFGRQPVNTQNSALRREYVPFWWAPRFCERHWDIVAGYLVQSLFDLSERASSGGPFTYSRRNEHDNRADIRNEDVGAILCENMFARTAIRPLAAETLLDRYRRVGYALQDHSDRFEWHLGEAVLAWADALQRAGIG